MSSKSETGHAVNIANFRIIIYRCTQFGADYNPPNPDITIPVMTTKCNAAETLHSFYLKKLEDTKLPVNNRQILFKKLDKIAVRTQYLYECTKASLQAQKNTKSLVRKITACNVHIPKLPNNIPDPNYVSNCQQGFVNKVDNFQQLIELYKTDTNYSPNETALTIPSLETLLNDLKSANNEVHKRSIIEQKHLIERNHALYDLGIGLIDISLACKNYVRSLYGPKSPEAKSVTSIPLRRIMKLNPL